ncbi:MAG: glycosyltransferase N-terminal domain-containing protein [Bacteroidota bacterium]
MSSLFILLYRIALLAYAAAIGLAAIVNEKARQWKRGRKGIWSKLAERFNQQKSDVIWMHCASLGEFEQGRPILEKIRKEFPHYRILLTFFSPSGYEVQTQTTLADDVFYLPLDSPAHAKKWVEIVRPKLVFFVKYEFWYFYLKTLQDQQIPVFLIAGVFRANQLFFKWYGKWYLEVIQNFDYLFLQDENSFRVIDNQGVVDKVIIGDPRIDRVETIAQTATPMPIIEAFKGTKKLLILGSSHAKDWAVFRQFLTHNVAKKYLADWQFLVAPHTLGAIEIRQIETTSPLSTIRYSQIKNLGKVANQRLLILDTMGQLSRVYQYGNAAFIGGGFGTSIHNILEPAAFGLLIVFGPRYQKFQEAVDLVALGSAFAIKNAVEWSAVFEQWQRWELTQELGQRNSNYIQQNIGATEEIISYLKNKNFI